MHATEREHAILELMKKKGFVAFRELEREISASPATLRRDLERMAGEGVIERVRGGARVLRGKGVPPASDVPGLRGTPFQENVARHPQQKEAIGRAAAELCGQGEAVMIDGGSTTLQMCRHLDGRNLQVLTTSLHIVSALLPQQGTRILVPGGSVFREQDIILSPGGDDLMPRFHAPKLFMGAAAIGQSGVMQADAVLVAAERRLIARAEKVIILADSSKFQGSSGHVVCSLDEVDTVITDRGITGVQVSMLERAGIEVIVAKGRKS